MIMAGKVDRKDVQEYYGRVLKTKADLKTSACCSVESSPPHIREIMGQLDDEILSKFYGCGSPIPSALEGCTVLDIADESIDVVVSNCVVNLSFDKPRLLKEIFRVLKPGGELYFSDVFTSRRIPAELKNDPVLIGECIAGAFYIEDFRRAMAVAGCPDVRIVSTREIAVTDPEVKRKIGLTRLYSQTVRAFKLALLEDRCEDFGQHATYLGTIPEEPHCFSLDDHHCLETGRAMLVCGNTAAMLSETRLARYFKVQGDRSVHFGIFDCVPAVNERGECIGGGCC